MVEIDTQVVGPSQADKVKLRIKELYFGSMPKGDEFAVLPSKNIHQGQFNAKKGISSIIAGNAFGIPIHGDKPRAVLQDIEGRGDRQKSTLLARVTAELSAFY